MTELELVPPIVEKKRPLGAGSSTFPDPAWGSRNTAFEMQVLQLVNQHRASKGLVLLGFEPNLLNCAGWKALHMAGYDYMEHDDPAPPVARTAWDRFAAFGLTGGTLGENIAYGYMKPDAVMTAWLSSPGHKANIESASYRSIGIGAGIKPGGVYAWCQCFSSANPTNPPTPPNPSTAGLTFSNRHAVGVNWDKNSFPSTQVGLYVWDGSSWLKLREQANSGETYLTYPMSYSGDAKVRVTDGIVVLEGIFTVRPVGIK